MLNYVWSKIICSQEVFDKIVMDSPTNPSHSIISFHKILAMESTSHYWLTLYTRLIKDGYNVHIFNPIQSDALRGMYIRQSKTDARDSFIIAEVIRFGKSITLVSALWHCY